MTPPTHAATAPSPHTAAAPVSTQALTLLAGDRVLIDRADLRLDAGQVLSLTGGAGTGKTLLLRALAGLPLPGVTLAGQARTDGRRLLIAQGGRLAPQRPLALQAADVIGHHLGLDASAALRRMADALDRMGVPPAARRFDLPPERLPDSLRWAALFALGIAVGPAVLLADAPAAGLDPTVRLRLLHRLAEWARSSATALILAGRPEDGLDGPADARLCLHEGRVLPTPPIPDPLPAPDHAHHPAGAAVMTAHGLTMSFPMGTGPTGEARRLTAVHSLDLELVDGETLVLLGESGSGKAMLARALLHLPAPSTGRVVWMGRDLTKADDATLRRVRRDVQPLFPDPAGSLDPAMTVGAQLTAVLESLRPDIPADRRPQRVVETLRAVGLPTDTATRWPASLRPLEAARVGLARALMPDPRALVCDEPLATLSAEDRAEFWDDLLTARDRRHLSLILTTERAEEGLRHADRALVLLMGRVVERGSADDLLHHARHPYTQAMLSAARGDRPALEGDPPSALRQPDGCTLRQRCPKARSFCAQAVPTLEPVGPGHAVACHYWDTP
ncbi:ABC transporter ATP-binding protein [Azospirillum griseum]|uniref:ATP-binding cassette domain-containing protein n=1 Tax=Azospirillum griseum TaxID=2496639 RepID=A0A431VJU1_9PROT|nr:oligopeptide/dipeptide ABC transporter ATP-binding protein [Azospirillum griseum]RTR22035.1 ATP-binding cassette domain-containing protein [Azospirillum griseum]